MTKKIHFKAGLAILLLAILAGIGFYIQRIETKAQISQLMQASLFSDEFLQQKKKLSQNASIQKDKKNYPNSVISCDVLIAGGGASGVTAAIESARLGVETCLIEETAWLGGMLTSAGVSSIDGSMEISSGINKEYIKKLQKYYQDKNQLDLTNDCTAGSFCYEPKVGEQIIRDMVEQEKNIKVFLNAEFIKTYSQDNKLVGLQFIDSNSKPVIAESKVIIDATEFGDIMYLADIPYDLGLDKGSNESLAKNAESCIQPITYVAVLKKAESNATRVPKPENYDPNNYACLHNSELRTHSSSNFDIDYVKKYGALPNGKVMLNIPSHSCGNDYNHDTKESEYLSRDEVLQDAKEYTLGLVYYLQEWLNYNDYKLYNEFGTQDELALIPYVRESRRLVGVERLTQNDILAENGEARPQVNKHSIAIGSYPIDLHFCTTGIGDVYQKVQPYQIPYEVLVPVEHDGFLAAEKNISVSRIVNGSSRVQPTVMSIGQAAGAAAALAVINDVEPRDVDLAQLQQVLIDSKSTIHYFKDLKSDHFAYETIVKYALSSNVSGYKDLRFSPDSGISRSELKALLTKKVDYLDTQISLFSILDSLDLKISKNYFKEDNKQVTFNEFVKIAYLLNTRASKLDDYSDMLNHLRRFTIIEQPKDPKQLVTRAEAIVIIDRLIEQIYNNRISYNI